MPKTLNIENLECAQWRQAIALGDFKRGKAYADQGRSSVLQLQGATVTAQCKGSAGQTYLQTITLLDKSNYYDINGRCSCYVGYNCKHVVAALLTLEEMQQQGKPPLSLSNEPSPPNQNQSAPALQIFDAPVQQPTPQLTFGSLPLNRYDARSARMQS